jgi:prepilin-type N-terminal cleavage/methylation domain-containing protein
MPTSKQVSDGTRRWPYACSKTGMRSERGYTLFEVLIVVGLIGIVSAISVPVFIESNARNSLWTGAEQVGATIRSARFKAISQNTPHRVVFNCPNANELRTIAFQDDPDIDDLDTATRCAQNHPGDSGIIELPAGVAYDAEGALYLEVNGRGIFSAEGAAIPLTVTVTHGGATRLMAVSGTGQVTFTDVE